MGQLYILKLRGGKWYVGYTERGIERVLEHLKNKGKFKAAKWTQKYRPENWKKAVVTITEDIHTLKDEDDKTLELMSKHGVRNVRGGKWCKVRMTKREIAQLEKKVRSLKKSPAKKKAKPRVTKGYCIRCGDRKKFDFEKPLCRDCYGEWAFYSNPDYEEDCCHKCGRDWGTTIDRPLCTSCWRKSS